MNNVKTSSLQRGLSVYLLSYAVIAHGLIIVFGTLVEQVTLVRVRPHLVLHHTYSVAPLFIGVALIYIGLHLLRQKRTAWSLAVGVYGFLVIVRILRIVFGDEFSYFLALPLRDTLAAGVIVILLLLARKQFAVKSDIRSFGVAVRTAIIVLAVAFLYGVTGFMLMDKHDFHQEISLPGAIHRTIDQFGLTTSNQLVPYTRRAKLFLNSLSTISTVAVIFVLLSLFQPLRVRFTGKSADRDLAEALLDEAPASSEDFFKLWPHDKLYFFNGARTAGLAYAARRGVAMVVGDPIGNANTFDALLNDFDGLCRTNDWSIAFIHTEPKYNELYKRHGFALQKIGEEAVIDLGHFNADVRRDKYFRQISNRFEKQGYHCEVLLPPHSNETIESLHTISKQWLSLPGRSERGFMMGYFNSHYMQECELVVLKDKNGRMVGFLNQIPSFDPDEANFDLLRHSEEAPGNSNDFMLMAFIDHVFEQGYSRLNLGLCPLSGLDAKDEERSVIGSALQFLYANGDRFYSFSGLRRFKSKYEPRWQSRYIAYRGGIRGFTRSATALNRAMKVNAATAYIQTRK